MLHRRAFLSAAAVTTTPLASGLRPPNPRGIETPHFVLISGSAEYESDRLLTDYAAFLTQHKLARVTLLKAIGFTELPGLEALHSADVALFFTRRLEIDGEPLERIKRYTSSGKPLVAVRTASHGFQKWLEMDQLVLGGNYKGHLGKDVSTQVRPTDIGRDHPILKGVEPFGSRATLYRTAPLKPDCTVLQLGKTPVAEQPVTWFRIHNGARVVTTSLGAQEDFENASFRRLLTNALFWAANRKDSYPEITTQPPLRKPQSGALALITRSRRPGAPADEFATSHLSIPLAQTAAILCDVWDLHWCRGATDRCAALAPRMNHLISALRDAAVQIIHAPSETMGFYTGTPHRQRARLAPDFKPNPPDSPLPAEPKLPIDDSDGGCDTDDSFYLAWTRQHPAIAIAEPDAVSDSGPEIERLLHQLGVKHVLVMGVHTNMCIINRPFAIRALLKRGFKPYLVRDLTDAMYDPRDPPHVPHDQGTNLVIQHVESHLCPSVASTDILEYLASLARASTPQP